MNYSFWWDEHYDTYKKVQPKLDQDITCQWVVVGGGMSGLFAALELHKSGQDGIVIVESFECGRGTTGASTGFVTPDSESGFADLAEHFGIHNAQWLWNYVQDGCDSIASTAKQYKLQVDIEEQDALLVGLPGQLNSVQKEYEALIHSGYTAELLDQETLSGSLSSTCLSGATKYPKVYGIDPLLYAHRLKEYLIDQGVVIYEHTHVSEVSTDMLQTVDGYTVSFEHAIVTINKPHKAISRLSQKIAGVQSSDSISRPLTEAEVLSLFPDGKKKLVYDTRDFYMYWRITSDNRVILGKDSLKTMLLPRASKSPQPALDAQREFKRLYPQLSDLTFEMYWSEIIDGTYDLIPLINREGEVTYSGGNVGLPWAARTGIESARVAMGQEVPPLLSTRRVPYTMFGDNPYWKIAQYTLYYGLEKVFKYRG